jgi:hypothetical protein
MKRFSILFALAVGLLTVGAVGAHAKIATNGESLNGTAATGATSSGVVNGIVLKR